MNTASVSNVLVGPSPMNLFGTKPLNIMSSNLATTALNVVRGVSQTQSILAIVFGDDSSFGLTPISNTITMNHLLQVKIMNATDLQISNEDSNFVVDISGQEMTMKLKITSTYDIMFDSKKTLSIERTKYKIEDSRIRGSLKTDSSRLLPGLLWLCTSTQTDLDQTHAFFLHFSLNLSAISSISSALMVAIFLLQSFSATSLNLLGTSSRWQLRINTELVVVVPHRSR